MIDVKIDYKSRRVLMEFKRRRREGRMQDRHAINALRQIGARNVKHARLLIKDRNKTGRIYYIPGIGRHQASAPGQSPADMTGNLVKQMDYTTFAPIQQHDGILYKMQFGNRAFYGRFLERGTKKIKPRPYIKKTIDQRGNANARILLKLMDKRVR